MSPMRRSTRSVPLLAAVVALAGCSDAPATGPLSPASAPSLAKSANAPVHRATGGGKEDIGAVFGDVPFASFGFSALVDGNGNAKGQMHADLTAPDVTFHADVTCLAVSGKDAWIGLVVKHTQGNIPFPPGTNFIVRVQDNGQGAGAEADRMSFFFPSFDPTWAAQCVLRPSFPLLFVWEHGNIQVD